MLTSRELGRRGHWLTLPTELRVPCVVSRCDLVAKEGWIYPARTDPETGGAAVLLACADHQEELRLRLPTSEAALPGTGPTRPSFHIVRSRGAWHRNITTEEAVAASGAMRCASCSERAMFLSWAVDHGVPDKWYPQLGCRRHTEERAAFNWGSMDEPGEYFCVTLTWSGTDWGVPLPWPLRAPAPANVVASIDLPRPSWTRGFGG